MSAGIWGREPGETGVISTITKIEFHGYGSVWGIHSGLRRKRSRTCPEVTVCGFCGGNKLGFLWVFFSVLTSVGTLFYRRPYTSPWRYCRIGVLD
jgi:hypothetical protein